MKNNKNNLLKDICLLMISQILIKIIGLLYKLYLTNKDGFGDTGNAIYSSGFQIYALLLTLSSTGVPNAISKLIAEKVAIDDYKNAEKILKIAFITFGIFGTVGSCILFLCAKTISNRWILIPESEISLIALAPSVMFVSLIAVIRGYFNGTQNFAYTAKSQTLEQILKTVFTIILVEIAISIKKGNVTIMAASANFATTLATAISLIYIYIKYKLQKKYKKTKEYKKLRVSQTIKNLIQVALPISLSGLIASFNKNIDSFTIVRFLKYITSEENAKRQYGILSGKIDSLCSLPFSINIAFTTTLIPNISRCIAIGKYNEVIKTSKKYILISTLIALPISILMFLFSEQILNILFPNANEGSQYLRWSSFSIVFMLISQTISTILQAIGEVNISPIAFGMGMIIKFICNITLIKMKNIGIMGAIIGNILCNIITFIIVFTYLKINLKIKFEITKFFLKPILATFVMGYIANLFYKRVECINSPICAIILTFSLSILLYIFLIFKLKILNKKDIEEFINKI